MSKPVTGVAMMMLYEEGKCRLDDPVSRYIPEFAKLRSIPGRTTTARRSWRTRGRSMTMRELMTHTAGLGYVLSAATR